MTDFLTALLSLTLGGGGAILLLLLLGRLTRQRYSARWRCWAWLLLCLRLAVPLPLPGLPSGQAPIQLPAPGDPILYEYAPPAQTPAVSPALSSAPVSASPVQSPPPQTPLPGPASGAGFVLTLSQAVFFLWLAGAAAVLGWNLFCHLRFCRWLRRWAVPVADEELLRQFVRLADELKLKRRPRLLRCQGVSSPVLAGLLCPAVLLPEDPAPGPDLDLALLHELTHFRRRDIWFKALALWVNALHWFNPLVWLMVRAVERDTELACDDAVLQTLPREDRARYSRTILNAMDILRKEP